MENALRGAAAAGTAVGIYAHTFRGFTIDHVRVEVHEAISTDFAPTLRCLQSYTPTAELPTTCI